MKKSFLILGVSLLLGSCTHVDADHSIQTIPDSSRDVINEQLGLQELNDNVLMLNGQFGIAETRSSNSTNQTLAIIGSDALGAIIGYLCGGWWGAIGLGAASSISSYQVGKDLDRNSGNGSNTSSNNNNQTSAFHISDVAGYDENGHELYYDVPSTCQDQPTIDLEEEIMANLGSLHNRIIISLYQQYGNNLATFSRYELLNRSIELAGSWYGFGNSEIPYFATDDDLFESCILENEEDYDSLMDDYPEYAGYVTIIKSFATAVSQMESSEQICSYKTQATSLIQNSNLSPSTKRTLQSGLDVLVCSNGLWILDEEDVVTEEDMIDVEEEDDAEGGQIYGEMEEAIEDDGGE